MSRRSRSASMGALDHRRFDRSSSRLADRMKGTMSSCQGRAWPAAIVIDVIGDAIVAAPWRGRDAWRRSIFLRRQAAPGCGQRRASAAAPGLRRRAIRQSARRGYRFCDVRHVRINAPRRQFTVAGPEYRGNRDWRLRVAASNTPAGEAEGLEPGQAAAFGLIGVDREDLGIAAAGMGDMIGAAAQAALAPAVPDFDHQRRMRRDGGMQAMGRLPGLEAHAAPPPRPARWRAAARRGH